MGLELAADIQDQRWLSAFPDLIETTRLTCQKTLERVEKDLLTRPLEISAIFTDDDTIRTLNRDFRHKDKPTNVLSFPLWDGARDAVSPADMPLLLGDLVFSLDTILKEATTDGKAPDAHLKHLLVHGILHLLGHDHETSDDAEAMETLEIEILSGFSIENPYLIDLHKL